MPAELTRDVNRAAALLKTGGLVAFATETVYGLGANALDELSVAKIFAAKQRPHFDPLIVHLSQASDVQQIVTNVPKVAQQLMDRFWPGPLTLVLPKRDVIPDLVTAGLPDVAVRVPDHVLARELIRLSGVPVAAPSANPFGRISPTSAAHVVEQLSEQIDMVLDGGACRIGLESTVLKIFPDETPLLLRPGGLTREQIEVEIGTVRIPVANDSDATPQASPGRLLKHYAPRKQLSIVKDWMQAPHGDAVGVLALEPIEHPERYGQVEILSSTGDLTEAAANFFAALRRLDSAEIDVILARRFPDQGLGRALNDRLTRAAQE